MAEYLVTAGCPACEVATTFVATTEAPVALDQDLAVPAEHCPCCRAHVPAHGGWDRQEEARIERVDDSQPLRPDGGVSQSAVERPVAEDGLSDNWATARLTDSQADRFATHRRDFPTDSAAVRELLALGMAAREAGWTPADDAAGHGGDE